MAKLYLQVTVLVLLGKVDGDIEALNVPGSMNVTIELIG
jgi:hypothetical protein